MKILYLIQRFLPYIGGAENHLHQIARRLPSNYETSVITFGSQDKKYQVGKISVRSYQGFRIHWGTGFTTISHGMLKDLLRMKPDIIHAHTYGFAHTDFASFIGKMKNVPFVVTTHYDRSKADEISKLLLRELYDNVIGRMTLSLANKILAVTDYEKKFLVSKFSLNDEKVSVIPNGVEVDKFRNLPDPHSMISRYGLKKSRVALFVGRIERKKGIQYLLRAASKVVTEFPNFKILVVGPDWGYQNELKKIAKNLKIENIVIFAGQLNELDLLKAYNLSEFSVLPSLGEATGLTILESMAAGRPIVASRLPTISEFSTHEKDGILFEPGNSEKLANSIISLMSNQKLKEKLIQNGKIISEQRDWSKIVKMIIDVYQTIIH
ncbi:glycosyltransferase family 1 protein [Candidatus Bathyarchaeota archaeon]|nr:glycosyltransferase family 1 protein [Candidatus Bathyarchaeota archaeon]